MITEKLPPVCMSEAVRVLKERFGEQDYTDYGLRHQVFGRVAREHPGFSNAMRIAAGYAEFLGQRAVIIHEYDLLAGRLRFWGYEDSIPIKVVTKGAGIMHKEGVDVHPMFLNAEMYETAQEIDGVKADGCTQAQRELLDLYHTGLRGQLFGRWGSGHVIAGYEKVLSCGYGGLIFEGEEALSKETDPEKRDYIEAMLVTNRAAIAYIKRNGEEAARLSQTADSEAHRRNLARIAQSCAHIAAGTPRNFFDAVQLLCLTHDLMISESVSGSISLGRVDTMLYPYYKADREKGEIDFDGASELIDAFWLKLGQLMEGFQNVALGGCDRDGNFIGSEVSVMGLRASRKLMIDQPLVSFRTRRDMPQVFWDEILELVRTGLGFPALFNDETVIAGKLDAGVSKEDAWKYGLVGCVEPSIGGEEYAKTEELRVNWAMPIELLLNGGKSPVTGEELPHKNTVDLDAVATFEAFLSLYLEEFDFCCALGMDAVDLMDACYGKRWPLPFMSSTMKGCYARGLDVTLGGTTYNLSTMNGCGMSDAVDSLCIIREFVFEKKLMSLSALARLLRENFEGAEPIRLLFENARHRFGNGDPQADALMASLVERFHALAKAHKNPFGSPYQIGLYTVSAHAIMGAAMGALPTGRKSGLSLANGFSPCHGADRSGTTAVVRSINAVDCSCLGNGMVLDIKFSPRFFVNETHRAGLQSLIETYFENGGLEVQFNVVSRETLLAAKADPQKYRNLIVRVSGFSAYFFHLDPVLQDEIIARTEYSE